MRSGAGFWARDQEEDGMTPQQHFELLTITALVDGKLQSEEMPLLKSFATRLQLSQDEAQEILDRVGKGGQSQLKMPPSKQERRVVFGHAIQIVIADRHLHPKEMDLLVKIGATFGLTREVVYNTVYEALNKITPQRKSGLDLVPMDEEQARRPSHVQEPVEQSEAALLARSDKLVLKDLARTMQIVGIVLWLIPAGLMILAGLGSFIILIFSSPLLALISTAFYGTQAAICLGIGLNTLRASSKFRDTTRSEKHQVRRLMAGMSALYTVFRIKLALIVLSSVMLVLSMCLVFGGAFAGLQNLPQMPPVDTGSPSGELPR